MEIEFDWEGKVHNGIAVQETRGGIPGYKVTIRNKERFFMGDGSGWSVLPFLKSYELKNRIGKAILEASSKSA